MNLTSIAFSMRNEIRELEDRCARSGVLAEEDQHTVDIEFVILASGQLRAIYSRN